MWGIHRSPVNSPHIGQWRRALIFSLICTRINGWVNNREAGDGRRHHAHYDVIVMNQNATVTLWSDLPSANTKDALQIYFNSLDPERYGCNLWFVILKPSTVGTPYNTNVGVQKIPDRAIWKPMVAKRNNTNPWSWLRPQNLVAQDSGQSHMSKQPAPRDWPEQIAPLAHSSQTAWQLFNLGQSIEIRIPHLLGHVGQLHTKCISHIWLRFSVL